ncbi:MAG: FeoB-associated Cys-rich membrane protein [Lachnospiraceae bacterium]|nr:FeoB-associated Cys-rich membrane protein [Lachnospiraceae bacterium]
MLSGIIILLIIVYVGFVIYRKVQNIRAGKYCNCGCEDCVRSCSKKKHSL